jgi:3-oxoacyl-[acyl-carrier-protein] synthase II
MPEWDRIEQLSTRLAAVIPGALPRFPRKRTRTMGRVGVLALVASDQAIKSAGLDQELLTSPMTGLCYGSTHGSTEVTEEFCNKLLVRQSLEGVPGSAYLKFMSHTCAANLAEAYGIRGRVVPIVSACTSASQSIGAGYEAIRYGHQDVMLCGGAEEMHPVHAAIFDLVYAASSKYNEAPDQSPRPFDQGRDGLVVGEGAGTLVLEEYEHAKKRGAEIVGEIIGYGTCCDGTHLTSPSPDGMARAMSLALKSAEINASQVDHINAHATATEIGDIAESQAVLINFPNGTPISSTKGHTGHTLGACGAIEAGFALWMLKEGFVPPTRNLTNVDSRCAPLNYLRGDARAQASKIIMSNNFAFGGINTSLILRKM